MNKFLLLVAAAALVWYNPQDSLVLAVELGFVFMIGYVFVGWFKNVR